MATGKYLSKRKSAERLDVSEKTIDRLRTAGQLDWIPVGRLVRITIASLEAYEARQRSKLQPEEPEDAFPIPALDELRARKAAVQATRAGEEAA